MSSPNEAEIQELLAEREDIKRQYALVMDNTLRMKEELARLHREKARCYTRKAAAYGELMAINGQATNQMNTRLSEIKQLLRNLTPVTFEKKFLRMALKMLPPDVFEQIEVAARQAT